MSRVAHALILCGACAWPVAARAEPLIHVRQTVFGCQKPEAATALNNSADPRRADPGWVAFVMGDGQCVRITPQSPWAVAGPDHDGLTLIAYRGTLGRPASFYVPSTAIDTAALPDPAGQDAAQAASPPVADAGTAAPPANLPGGYMPPPGHAPADAPSGTDPSSVFAGLGDHPAASPATKAPAPPSPDEAAPGGQDQAQPHFATLPPLDNARLAAMRAQVNASRTHAGLGIAVILLTSASIAALLIGWRLRKQRLARHRADALLHRVRAEIEANTRSLHMKRRQTLLRDEYGTLLWDPWLEAKAYYIQTRIEPILARFGDPGATAEALAMADALIEDISSRAPEDDDPAFAGTDGAPADRLDYELFCASRLRHAGWDVRLPPPGAGQGAGIIASRHNHVLAVHCLPSAVPVGEDAVRQAGATRHGQAAQDAALVSNQPYTRRARHLADTCGVVLLHHDDLPDFDPARLGLKTARM